MINIQDKLFALGCKVEDCENLTTEQIIDMILEEARIQMRECIKTKPIKCTVKIIYTGITNP